MSEKHRLTEQGDTGFRADQVPNLPESETSRKRLGEDPQPVGDYAGIAPYYRTCEDAAAVQYQDQNIVESEDGWWNHQQIRFVSGKAFVGKVILC